ncbi:substance-P receptor-like [Glandiceps talaboti]
MESMYNFTEEQLAIWEAKIRAYIREKQAHVDDDFDGYDNTSLDDYNYEDMSLSQEWRVGLIFAFSCNIGLTIIGNMVVLIVLFFGRARSELNAFLTNLALADLTMAIFCMPFTFSTIMNGHWIFGNVMCPTVIFLQQVSVIVSVYTLTAIGIDRYYAVIYPFKVRVTKNRSKILLAIIWILAVGLAVVQTVFTRTMSYYYDRKTVYLCMEWDIYASVSRGYEIFIVLLTYVAPLCVLTFTYTRVGLKLWGRNLPGNTDQQRDRSHASSKRKIIKMLILVVLLFALCWLPLHVFMMITRFLPYIFGDTTHQDMMRKVNACVLWLAMSNSFMNPLLYCILNDGFRADLKALFLRRQRLQKSRTVQSSARTSRSRSVTSSTSTLLLSNIMFLGFRHSK